MIKHPSSLIKLIQMLKKLPGVGNKSAERFAFHLLEWHPQHLDELAFTIQDIKEKLRNCSECGCLIEQVSCSICEEVMREQHTVCVVASCKDVFTIEQTHEYKGLYHVLGGVLSPMEGKTADKLSIGKLKTRISKLSIREVIIALDSTLEGDTTALFLKQQLAECQVNVLRLAFGLPMGSSLDYVDGGTLARALKGRLTF